MPIWIIALVVFMGVGAVSYRLSTRNKQSQQPEAEMPYADEVQTIYGIENGIFSLKDGGAGVLFKLDGLDYESVDDVTLTALNQDVAEVISYIMQVSGNNDGSGGVEGFGSKKPKITIKLCYDLRRRDSSDITRSIRQAEANAQETGLAAHALLDGEYMSQGQNGSGGGGDFWSREYFFNVSVSGGDGTGGGDERDKANLLVTDSLDDEDDDEAAASNNGSTTTTNPLFGNSGGGGFGAKAGKNLAGGMADFRKTLRGNKLEIGGNGGIATHPISQDQAQTLHQLVEGIVDVLSRYGSSGHVATSVEAAEYYARLCWLPTKAVAETETEINYQTARVMALTACTKAALSNNNNNDKGDGNGNALSLTEDGLRTAVENRLLALGWSKEIIASNGLNPTATDFLAGISPASYVAASLASSNNSTTTTATTAANANTNPAPASFFTPRNGDPNGPIDVAAAFGQAPIEFFPGYIKVGVHPAIEAAHLRLKRAVRQLRGLQGKPSWVVRIVGDITASASNDYYLEHWPRPSYLSTLVSFDWGKRVEMGAVMPLLSRTGIEMTFTTVILPLTTKKATKKLARQRNNIVLAADVDKDPRSALERRRQLAEIDSLAEQLTGQEAVLNMVGQRITVRADSPLLLKRATRQVTTICASMGLTVIEAYFNQAFAWFSTLPVGVDWVSNAMLVGGRTIRNMTSTTTACFFPALIPDLAANGGLLAGQADNGGLIRLNDKNLISPHEMGNGISGAGKTLNQLMMLIRQLYTDTKRRVRIVDPQGVADEVVRQCNGAVADLAPDGGIRLNFLNRFNLGGRAQPFNTLCDVFLQMLTLMQPQSFDETVVKEALNLLFLHFEQGQPITHYVVRSLANRFFDDLGFGAAQARGEIASYQQTWLNFLEPTAAFLAEQFQIPATTTAGFVVRVVRDPADPNRALARQYPVAKASGGEIGGAGAVGLSEPGVVLEVLNTFQGGGKLKAFNRNYYAGGGTTQLEIPAYAYRDIVMRLKQKPLSELEYEARLTYALTAYLAGPSPRRFSLVGPVAAIAAVGSGSGGGSSNNSTSASASASHYLKTAEEVRWVCPPKEREARLASRMPGAHLLIESGPVWYADEEWEARIFQEFKRRLGNSHLLDKVDVQVRRKVERDCFVILKFGVPILSDTIGLIASEDFGRNIARNLEPYCNNNIAGEMFNGHTNTNTHSRFFSFNVKNLTDNIRPLRMMQCLELIWSEIAANPRGSGIEYTICIDEFGILASQSPQAATYVGLLFKRARAFGAKIVVLEQNVQTFNSLAGKYIMDNVGKFVIMHQSEEAANWWADLYHLTVEERNRLTQLEPGEALLIQVEGNRTTKRWIKYGMHPRTLRILSTKPGEVAAREAERRVSLGLSDYDLLMEDLVPTDGSVAAAS